MTRLSTAWPQLAPSQTSPVPTPLDPCLWSCLKPLPERLALPATSSLVFQGTDGAQSIHNVSRCMAHLQEGELKGENSNERLNLDPE